MSDKGIISNLSNYLRQPEEGDFTFKEGLKSGLTISIAVAVIVYFFNLRWTPFDTLSQIKYSFYFGCITFIVALLNDQTLPRIFTNWFAERNWTIGKGLLLLVWNFVTIAIGNMIFMVYMGWMSGSFSNFGRILGLTFIVGIIPIIIASLWRHNKKLKSRLHEASQLNTAIQKRKTPSIAQPVSINIDSNQKKIKIPVEAILFVSSERNYVRFVMTEGEDIIVRNTIKKIADSLSTHTHIVRCHRAFIVNTQQVDNVAGNAQGLRLSLKDSSEIVPVSRSYIPLIKSILN